MRSIVHSLLALLLASSASVSRADVIQCAPQYPPGVICLTNNVSNVMGGGPLVAGQVYHLFGVVTVPAGQTLTIQPGAILKFGNFAVLAVFGTLDCGGATLTSLKDDAAGGDTNGDGAATQPAPGDWGGIQFFSAGSIVNGAKLMFGSTGITHFGGGVNVQHNGIEVSFCSGVGFSTGLNNQPTVTGCTFNNNELAAQADIKALPGFLGNTATDNVQGDCIEIIGGTVTGNTVIGPQNSLDGRPFAVCPSITVQAGATLDLQPGVVLKFGSILSLAGCNWGDITVAGTLLTDGVVITALEDDTIGGDLDKGGPSFGTPGDIGRLIFQQTSDASAVRNTVFRFGGFGATLPQAFPAIDLLGADVLLDNVQVTDCSAQALRLNAGINASFPTVTDCSFTTNLGSAVVRVPIDAVAGFSNNTASGNLLNAMEIAGGNLAGFAAVGAANALNGDGAFILRGNLTVNAGATLQIGPGVAFKWDAVNFALDVAGTLLANGTLAQPVVMTSLEDDAIVGDTNEDGGATQPAPGDWVGIDLASTAGASVLDAVVVRYAGSSGLTNGAVEVSCSATLSSCVVELSETAGMDLQSFGVPTVSTCTFQDNDGRAVVGAILAAVPGFTGCTATGNAGGDAIRVINGDVSYGGSATAGCGLTIGPANALAPDLVTIVADDVDVPAGCLLSLLGGTILKFEGLREVDVDGSLQVGGDGGGTVVLTSVLDGSVGGSDGPTAAVPGAWRGLVVNGPGTVLQDLLVRCAGNGGQGIKLVNAPAQLSNVRVEDCLGAGLHLTSTSLPLVDGCSFDRNDLAVDGVPIRALPGFSNCDATDNKVGDYQRVTDGDAPANLSIQAGQSTTGGVFVVADDVVVFPGAVLTLGPNTTFKHEGDRTVEIDGTLSVDGPVVLTTLPDDVNGDTNKDMGTTVPVPGSWSGIVFDAGSDASVVSELVVRYAGSLGAASVRVQGANPTILDSTVEQGGGPGLRLSGGAKPSVRRTTFDANLGLAVDGLAPDAVAGFVDNTGSGNTPGDYVRITQGSYTGNAVIERRNSLNGTGVFVVNASPFVDAIDTLTLRQGTILKFEGANRSVVVNGTVRVEGTGLEPVVLTSIHDDAFGGDTKNDGAAVPAMPGDWARFEIASPALPSSVEHLLARFGGATAFAAIELESDLATARSIRAEHSSTDGIRGHRHLGDAVNWVAFGNGGDGIELGVDTFDVVHATVASNGGAGIRRTLGHAGSLRSSISFGNTGAPVVGFAPGEVLSSDVGPAFAGVDGNIDADPLFLDPVGGDLALGAGSPCVDAADFATALAVVKDFREASRILDDGFDGSFAPDMGALERAAYTLSFGGEPRLGTVMSFAVDGAPAGLAVVGLGLTGGETLFPPFGFTLYGAPGTELVLGVVPTGQPVFVQIPLSVAFIDLVFGVQGVGLPNAVPGAGHLTNLYRGRVFG